MDAIEAAEILRLGLADAPDALPLSIEARWNQTAEDWRFFLGAGHVYGIRDVSGALVATAALLPHGDRNAWISMVLVTERCRRRGLATRLVDRCLATAAALALVTWLDATPDGATVYGPLGFKRTFELRRLRLQPGRRSSTAVSAPGTLPSLMSRDRDALGFERTKLLAELAGRRGSTLRAHGHALALVRDGRTARHVAPLFAADGADALALIDAIAAQEQQALLIDAVETQSTFIDGLVARGWTVERPFLRMRFGAPGPAPSPSHFAVAGPEYG